MAKSVSHILKLISFNLIATLFLLELILCTSIGNRLHIAQDYLHIFETEEVRWRMNLKPYSQYRHYSQNEFDITYQTNNFGLRGDDFTSEKEKFRILTLGDSFTEGVGATNDSTWQNQILPKLPYAYQKDVEICNAGVGGHDPLFSYDLYSKLLYKLKPNLIILAINNSDVLDIVVRGGHERFTKNDGIRFKSAPHYSWLLKSRAARLITRLFCDYSYTPIWKQEEEYGKANGIIWWVIEEFKSLSIAQNIDFLVVFSPIEWELVTGTEYKFKPVLDSCKANSIPFLDIRDEFKRLGVNVGTDEGRLINLYRHFVSNSEAGTNSSNPKNLYWPIDYHFNNFGYALFATALLNEVMRSYNHQIQNSHLLTTENPIPRNPNSASAH